MQQLEDSYMALLREAILGEITVKEFMEINNKMKNWLRSKFLSDYEHLTDEIQIKFVKELKFKVVKSVRDNIQVKDELLHKIVMDIDDYRSNKQSIGSGEKMIKFIVVAVIVVAFIFVLKLINSGIGQFFGGKGGDL